jgi:hypothetical protein
VNTCLLRLRLTSPSRHSQEKNIHTDAEIEIQAGFKSATEKSDKGAVLLNRHKFTEQIRNTWSFQLTSSMSRGSPFSKCGVSVGY